MLVPGDESLESADLVCRVVIDVHLRALAPSMIDVGEEVGERLPLPRPIMSPPGHELAAVGVIGLHDAE